MKPSSDIMFDYIVVGAGAAGCALASRLSRRPDINVLLIEAGPRDDHFLIHMPKGFPYLTRNLRYAWNFDTEAQPHRNFGPEMWPRGRMLGGSSSINGMLYSRGHPQDYDDWEAAGNPGWGWSEVGRCFREMEDHSAGAGTRNGTGGPLRVTAGSPRSDLSESLVEAGVQSGLERHDGADTPFFDGIGYSAVTTRGGKRMSAARAYLKPIAGRANLTILTETEVERVLFEDKRAVGVVAHGPGGQRTLRARREVILSGGTLLSPRILMHSGIGDGSALQAFGIAVEHANSHIGAHLRDHVGVSMPYRLTGARGLNHELRGLGLLSSLLRYFLLRQGILSKAGEVSAFFRAHPTALRPDAQLMLLSLSQSPPRPGRFMGDVEREPGFVAMGCILNATSEGDITLASPDPRAQPRIQANSLSTDHDRETVVEIVKFIRQLVRQPALASKVGAELEPWCGADSDAEILDMAMRRSRNFNHAVGTCRMGDDGVVDARLKVHGVDGLRIADLSVMPVLPSGNTNGPAQMVGWRAAELILEDLDRR